jgi:hypothetical protein
LAADLPALEPVVLDGARQLVCGGFRRWRGERGEPGEARGMPLHGGPELIVRVAGDGDGDGRIELFHARGHQREDLQIDPRGLHRGDAPGVQVAELGIDRGHGKGPEVERRAPRSRVEQRLRRVMLFEGDRAHHSVPSRAHSLLCSPPE